MTEIKHNREIVDGILKKMDRLKSMVDDLGLILDRLANEIQANFSGESEESLVALLNHEVKKIKLESENWQSLYEQTVNVAKNFEEQDEKIII